MSDTEQQQAYAREDLEVLARWMGWEPHPQLLLWYPKEGARLVSDGRWIGDDWNPDGTRNRASWNPFTDANADVQVLERARDSLTRDEFSLFATAVSFFARNRWTSDDTSLAESPSAIRLRYLRTGDYARAALAVLRSQPPEAQQVNDAR